MAVLLIACVSAASTVFPAAASRGALTPSSPEVQAAVARGTKFLETASDDAFGFGAKALVGIALLKTGTSTDHAQIQRAVESIRDFISKGPHDPDNIVYSLGLSLIFLVELDSEQYKAEIDWLLKQLLAVQKPHGGWGYLLLPTGDTSQTQYAVLALWTAANAGIATPDDAWKRVMDWLIRTQDVSGGFGYQGTDPGSYVRVSQMDVRQSLTAAAAGSLYICQDHLLGSRLEAVDPSVPSALRSTGGAEQRASRASNDQKRLRNALRDGDAWTVANFAVAPQYAHYYMYAFERHQSFKQVSGDTGRTVDDWYDRIARHLLETQNDRGAWVSSCGEVCDTAFAVLFLIRSTQQNLIEAGRFGAGTLVGGRGLPAGTDELDLRMGRVTARPRKGPADELLGLMEDPNHPGYLAAVRGFELLAEKADVELLEEHAAKLRRLAHGADPEARVAAVRALASTRDLDNVPTLIYALSDPDVSVATAANEGLKSMSRKTRGYVLDGDVSSASRQDTIRQWREWYRTIRPDAEFED